MLAGDKKTLISNLITSNSDRNSLSKIQIINSTSDAKNFSDLCGDLTYTVLKMEPISGNYLIDIVVCSNLSGQNRIFVLDASIIGLREFIFCLNLLMAISNRTVFGFKDIRRSILLTERREFFLDSENIKIWDLIAEHASSASAFDITLGQLHIPIFLK